MTVLALQCGAAAIEAQLQQRRVTCQQRLAAPAPFTKGAAPRRVIALLQLQQRRQGVQRQLVQCAAAAAAPAKLEKLVVEPISKIEGHVKLPGSKSLTNRILLLAALAEGTTVVENVLVSCRRVCPGYQYFPIPSRPPWHPCTSLLLLHQATADNFCQ